jgi:deoxyadenosine/deoxycytidine kinase
MSEPIDKWLNLKGFNLIELLYKDINRWSFAFEHYAQLTRLQMYENFQNIDTKPVRLMERSIFSAKYCFTENLFRRYSSFHSFISIDFHLISIDFHLNSFEFHLISIDFHLI